MPVKYGSLPFEEQIAFFRNKTNMPTERWADLWKHAHNRGFMVAGAMKEDLLADFRAAVDKAISEGKSLNWFKSQFNDIVKRHGWDYNGHKNWRSQVIYETNLRQSYTAGREQQIEQIKDRRPYGIYKHSGSEHPRHDHLSWNNLVLPLDDPWWETHTPINGYGCKCKKLTASKRTLERLGLEVGTAPKVETYEWTDKVTGEVHRIPKGIDPGFDYTPKSSAELTKKTRKAVAAKPPLKERLTPRTVDHAFSTVKGVNAIELSRILDELPGTEPTALKKAMDKHDFKTLFVKAGEMSGKAKARAIAEEVAQYLGKERPSTFYYSSRRPARTNGFTSKNWSHVVVKALSTDRLSKVSASQLQEAVARAISDGKTWWSFSESVRNMHGNPARVVTTWAHEIGHQIHFKAGAPKPDDKLLALTRYAQTNVNEWFAEHFVAWLFAPEELKAHSEEIYTFITDTVEQAV